MLQSATVIFCKKNCELNRPNEALRFNEMEHMLLCLFHASEECHSSRHLPCSASFCSYCGPPVLLQAKVQVGVVCIAAVRDRQSNTLLFSAADG
jgi:hypothetical protein